MITVPHVADVALKYPQQEGPERPQVAIRQAEHVVLERVSKETLCEIFGVFPASSQPAAESVQGIPVVPAQTCQRVYAQGGIVRSKKSQHSCPAVSYTHLRAHETPEHLVC